MWAAFGKRHIELLCFLICENNLFVRFRMVGRLPVRLGQYWWHFVAERLLPSGAFYAQRGFTELIGIALQNAA